MVYRSASRQRVVAARCAAACVCALLLLGPAGPAWAAALQVRLLPVERQAAVAQEKKVDYAYDEQGRHRLRLAAKVEDQYGRPVRGLSLPEVSAIVDGEYFALTSDEMKVAPAFLGPQGLTLALVVDTSTSMYGAPVAECKALCLGLVRALGQGDRVGLVHFSDAARTVGEYTSDKKVLEVLVDALKVDTDNDGSALADAVMMAVEGLPADAGFRAVAVMADGENVGSLSKLDDVVAAAVAAGCPVFVIGSGQREIKEATLEQLASGTGGRRLMVTESGQDVLAKIRRGACPHYQVEIETKQLPADGRSHQIALRVDLVDGSGTSDAAVFVTGVGEAGVAANTGLVLIPVLLVLLSATALLLLTKRRLGGQAQPDATPSPAAGDEPGPAACPVCRQPMPEGQTKCEACGYEVGKVISVDDVEE